MTDALDIYTYQEVEELIAERDTLAAKLEEARVALKRLHDECGVLRSGEALMLGPMMAPSEQSVLAARAILESDDG